MQTRSTSRLAKKLSSYARLHSWSQTAKKYSITGPDGRPSRALAKLIADGYEPHRPNTRSRCGLPEKLHPPKPVTINQMLRLPISEMPVEILKLSFEYREEMQ